MASINISITDEAYRFLKILKGKDKSFSQVILGMKNNNNLRKGSKEHVLKFAGGLKDLDIDWIGKEKRMKDFRESFDKSVEDTIVYMEKKKDDDRS